MLAKGTVPGDVVAGLVELATTLLRLGPHQPGLKACAASPRPNCTRKSQFPKAVPGGGSPIRDRTREPTLCIGQRNPGEEEEAAPLGSPPYLLPDQLRGSSVPRTRGDTG